MIQRTKCRRCGRSSYYHATGAACCGYCLDADRLGQLRADFADSERLEQIRRNPPQQPTPDERRAHFRIIDGGKR